MISALSADRDWIGVSDVNVLEKILEEIEEKFKTADAEKFDCEELCDVEDWYDSGYIDGQLSAYEKCMDIIRSHMGDGKGTNVLSNNGWIPVEERLPKEKGWYQCTCSDNDIWNKDIVRDLYYYPETKEFVDNIRYENNGLKNIEKYYWTKYVTAWQNLPEPYKPDEN